MAGTALLVVIGVAQALANLPVVTGCGFYGICGRSGQPAASDPMVKRVEED